MEEVKSLREEEVELCEIYKSRCVKFTELVQYRRCLGVRLQTILHEICMRCRECLIQSSLVVASSSDLYPFLRAVVNLCSLRR